MQRLFAFAGRTLITAGVAIFTIAMFLPISASAARTTVSVTNNTPYPMRAVFKAVGCVQFFSGSADSNETSDGVYINNRTDEVCAVKDVASGATVSYEFGGGTSGRKVWAEILSISSQMLIPGDQNDAVFQAAWNSAYVNNSAIVKSNWAYGYDLYDDQSNSCAVKGFGIIHDAHVTWTKFEVHEDCHVDYCKDELFKADCGSVVSQPEAIFVGVGECETKVRNRIVDGGRTLLQQVVGGLADDCAAGAKNHGKIVSCITQGLDILAQVKVITGAEKGAITACAAQAFPAGNIKAR
ncbi:hypothetical protein [Occallatibacter riparius]|uniref:Uncharacterized protein n=1 Tax=Occallatibacter riparius TaxID=1002689 RepID=A0A9J7BLK1_9BACT|nr:hypothetical protein [Occallatibacter riparius]UWZ83531.1 hypothetical protein MOP44_23560 [Occallatibacter riparius]